MTGEKWKRGKTVGSLFDFFFTYHVTEDVGGILEDTMGVLSFDVGDKADTAGIFLVLGVVKTLGNGECAGPGGVGINVVAVHEGFHF